MPTPRFTAEQILQSARVQAGMFVDQHFAQVPIALRAAIRAQPSKAYGRAMATALYDALIERLTEARDEILAEFAEPVSAQSLWPGGHSHAPDDPCGEGCPASGKGIAYCGALVADRACARSAGHDGPHGAEGLA